MLDRDGPSGPMGPDKPDGPGPNDEPVDIPDTGKPMGNETEVSDIFSETDFAFAVTNILPVVMILLLNVFVVRHYKNQYKKFVPCMYLLNSLCDGLMAIFVLVQSGLIIQFYQNETVVDIVTSAATHVTVIATILLSVFYRVSIFVNVLLCVARTIKIKYPFYIVKMKLAMLSVAAYFLVWLAVATYDYYKIADKEEGQNQMTKNYIVFGKLGAEIGGTLIVTYDMPNEKNGIKTVYGATALFMIILIPFIIPCICSLVCLFIMVSSLRKPSLNENSAARQKHVTITVTWITFLFVVCNSIATLYFLFGEYIYIKILENEEPDYQEYIYPLLNLTLPLLNAAVSPLIIILRSQDLKNGLKDTFRSRSSKTAITSVSVSAAMSVRSNGIVHAKSETVEERRMTVLRNDNAGS